MTFPKDPNRLSTIFGVGAPFATRFGLVLLFGPLVYLVYRAMVPSLPWLFGFRVFLEFPIVVAYGPSLIFLGAMFLLHRRLFPDIAFVGTFSRRSVVIGCIAISIAYLATHGAAKLLGQPREPAMVSLFLGKTEFQIAVLVLSLLLLPPIAEELAFRHFMLSALPFNANLWICGVAVTGTALVFALAHPYLYLTSRLLIFALAIIFGIARARSGGMLLPIGLHAYSIALGLLGNQLAAYLET